MSKLKDFVYKVIRKPYYYIPPCPVCGSEVTGRIVSGSHRATERDWMINEALRNGEIMLPSLEDTDDNCFCVECGATWYHMISMQMFTLDQINKEKKKRGTAPVLSERYAEIEKREEESPRGTVAKFIGKL